MKEFTAQQVEAALQTAMAISSPDPANPVRIPVSHAAGILLLNNVAAAILRGDYVLVPRGEPVMDADISPGGTDPDDD